MTYLLTPIVDTPGVVGDDQDGVRRLAGAEGIASYGPYQPLEAGKWFAGFNIRAVEPPTINEAIRIDVCHNGGVHVLGKAWFGANDFCQSAPGLLGVEFEVTQPLTDYELRLYFAGSGTFDLLDKLVFRTDLD